MRPSHLLAIVLLFSLSITASTVVAKQLGWWPPAEEPVSNVEVPPARGAVQPQVTWDEARRAHLVSESASVQGRAVTASMRSVPHEAAAREALAPGLHPLVGEAILALPHAGRSPADGLPAAGMRCSLDGGAMTCGACRSDSECPAGMGCVANRDTRRFECLASECEEDVHCFPGLVCRPVTTGAAGPVIRRCVPAGVRREGEPCDGLFISQEGACQEGLSCHRSICSRPCRLGDAASCPEGHSCEDGLNGPACFPDCRSSSCPTGQQCKQLNESHHQCLSEVKGECPEKACGSAERCNMRLSRGRGVFWCAALCNPLRADSCPAGQVCGMGSPTISTCYRRCDPMMPEACGEGWQCTTVSEDMTQWGCSPVTSP